MMPMRFVVICMMFFCACAVPYTGARADDVNALVEALEHRLKQLERKPMIWAQKKDETPLVFDKKFLREGDSHPDMPKLRARLADFMPKEVSNTDMFVFGVDLTSAVKAFQRHYHLRDDGIIGPQTLALINRTAEEEKRQIALNLHRLNSPEWRGRPDLRIDVDVARYWLTAYEQGKPVFEMPVVVGTQERQTNIFSTMMTGVRLNPGWTLPPTIKAEDYIPKLRENPEWVTEKGVMIYANWDQDATPIDPTLVDWNYLTDNQIKAMRFYKMAGDNNPLGQYRFLMHNKYDIYLHDTNQKYLFDRSSRAYSSGCVRVNDPRRIVEFLLAENPDWTPDKLDRILEEGKTFDLRANRSIPVYFDYKTAWLDSEGQLVLGYDIYGLDETVYHDMLAHSKKGDITLAKSLEDYF